MGTSLITQKMNDQFCENLKNNFEVEDTVKFSKLVDLEASSFAKLFCKSSWDDKINKKWKNLQLPVMDKN